MSDPYDAYPNLELDRPAPHVLRLTLRAAGRLNAVSGAMHGELAAIWKTIGDDEETRAVVVRGRGRRVQRGRRSRPRRGDRERPGGAPPRLPRGARPRLQHRLVSHADRVGDDGTGSRCRARGRPARRHLDRDARHTHRRRPHEARRRRRRPCRPRLAASVRSREGEVPPAPVRAARRRRGRAASVSSRCASRRTSARSRSRSGSRGAQTALRHEARVEQLAQGGGGSTRSSSSISPGRTCTRASRWSGARPTLRPSGSNWHDLTIGSRQSLPRRDDSGLAVAARKASS